MPYNNTHIKGWLRLIIFIFLYLFFGVLFYFIGELIVVIDSDTSNDLMTQDRLIRSFIDLIAFLCVLWICMKFIDDEPFINLGLDLKNRARDILIGIFLGAGIMSIAFISLWLSNQIEFNKVSFKPLNLVNILLLFVVVSLKEELVVRGYFLRNLMYSFRNPIALIISSAIFSLVHGFNPNIDSMGFLNLFLAGITLGLPYIYEKNLWLPIAIHFSWNFFQSLLGFNVSGINSYSLIEFSIPKENMINGGSFGFEGSILSVIFQLITISVLFIWLEKRRGLR